MATSGKKVSYTTVILKFGSKGEKTGWTYVEVPADVASRLKPGMRKSFRVKGMIDQVAIEKAALIPMGAGDFIFPLNAAIRKKLGKKQGAMVSVRMEADDREMVLDADLVACLDDDPETREKFYRLPPSHRSYFSKWIGDAKTNATKAKRIALALEAVAREMNFGEMLREKAGKPPR